MALKRKVLKGRILEDKTLKRKLVEGLFPKVLKRRTSRRIKKRG